MNAQRGFHLRVQPGAASGRAGLGWGAGPRTAHRGRSSARHIFLILLGFASAGHAGVFGGNAWREWEVSGHVEAETRTFPETPAARPQFEHFDASLALKPGLFRRWEDLQLTFTLEAFGRLDLQDDARTHFDLREMMFVKSADQWDLRAGVGKVFWGVTESQHLVDTINQTDFVENVDGEEKLGQPMVNFAWITDRAGTFSLFYLPYFRERTFPGVHGRLRTIPYVDTGNPIYESRLREWHPDLSLRWFNTIGEFDVGVHYFYGTSRDPLFSPSMAPDGSVVLRPIYNLMHQFGLDVQWTHDSWLWKLEAIAREGKGQHYQAFVGGFEYTFYGVFGTASDLGVLGEYHYDSRGAAALNFLNNDLFAGTRWAMNDSQDTATLAGLFYDHETGSSSVRVEFERRLGAHLTLEVEGQWFIYSNTSDVVYDFQRDSFIQIALKRYF